MLRRLFERARLGFVLLGGDGTVLEANAAAGAILGQRPSPGEPLADAAWGRRLGLLEHWPRLVAGETVTADAAWEEEAEGEEGVPLPRALHAVATQLPNRRVCLLLADRSTEARARTDARIRRGQAAASRTQLEAIVEELPGGVVVAEAPSGRIVLGNRRMEEILGHPILEAEAVDGYHQYGAEHPDGRPYLPEEHPLARAVAGEHIEGMEVRYRRPTGELRILSANAAPIRGTEGGIEAALVALFDLTGRWRAEESVRLLAEAGALLSGSLDEEQTFRGVVDLAVPRLSDLCIVYVREADTLHRTHLAHADTPVSRRFAEVWERYEAAPGPDHPAWAVARTGQTLHVPEASDAVLQRVATSPAHLESLRELPIRAAFVVPLGAGSEVLGAVAFVQTERGRSFDDLARYTAEEIGRRAGVAAHNASLYRRAQQAIRSREEVLSVVSHDLRGPLSIVGVTADLLVRRAEGEAPDRALAASGRALRHAADRMLRLIEDLLDLSSIDTGRLRIRPRRERIADLLGEVATAYAELAATLGRHLTVEVTDDLAPVVLSCDRARVMQILGNLVDNALKHTPVGSTVRIRGAREGDAALISVTDDGPGIAPSEQARTFDRFWKKEDHPAGVGLGLFIAKNLVEAHGGRIWVESAPGAGARFLFTLPLPREEPGALAEGSAPPG